MEKEDLNLNPIQEAKSHFLSFSVSRIAIARFRKWKWCFKQRFMPDDGKQKGKTYLRREILFT